ncbi:uncharacterized protein LOC124294488 [Neodiprion lecontei]|uniref:Uncharacterized protein LOC124294488 n=1 Tax=Neodiprion lecontei TaxID=441921 RepID=A0ABM3G621_NEOLC|nr:uncharacterized protein LOC124294488 [Neodiprion lecontei]
MSTHSSDTEVELVEEPNVEDVDAEKPRGWARLTRHLLLLGQLQYRYPDLWLDKITAAMEVQEDRAERYRARRQSAILHQHPDDHTQGTQAGNRLAQWEVGTQAESPVMMDAVVDAKEYTVTVSWLRRMTHNRTHK